MRNKIVTQWLLCALGLWLLSQQCGQCFYDPSAQRWISRDPFAENAAIDLYSYVKNLAGNSVDPWGWSDINAPPGSVTGGSPGVPNPNPILPGAGQVPPGYSPSWPTGFDSRGAYVMDPSNGTKYYPHPEDSGHWPHYDWRDPSGKEGRYPVKCKKPWPGQKKLPYGDQSATDPWAPPARPAPPSPNTTPILVTPGLPGLSTYPVQVPVADPLIADPVFVP